MTRELHILCGIPGSGKSTWCKAEQTAIAADNMQSARISRDVVRFAWLDANPGSNYFEHEDDVFAEFCREIEDCLKIGFDHVFADATHISYGSRAKVLRNLLIDPDTKIVFDVFTTPFEICTYRNGQREGRECVPMSAMKSMQNGFKIPDEAEINLFKKNFKNEFEVRLHDGR